jgi:hypothetical protein
MNALLLLLALLTGGVPPHVEGPCKAVHYGREGSRYNEVSMSEVVANRQLCPGEHCIPTFKPRTDVVDFIAVRNADQWRIAQNWRVLIVFKLPGGGYSRPRWYQPVDYQQRQHMTSGACRVETSERAAASMGWSLFANDEGRTTAYILQWEK